MAVSEEECSNPKSFSSSSAVQSSASSSAACDGSHYLAKYILRGSVVLQVACGHIRSPTSDDVVFGKETSIELVHVGDNGVLKTVCEQPVFGIIKDVSIVPWNENFKGKTSQKLMGKDLVAIVSDSGKLSFLTFCTEMNRFFPLTQVEVSSHGNSRHHMGRRLVVDPSGCFIATSSYVGRLAIYSLCRSIGNDLIHKTITYPSDNEGETSFTRSHQRHHVMGTIWSMCFISRESNQSSKEHNPVLAIIQTRRASLLNELKLLEWSIKEDVVNVLSLFVEVGTLAHDIAEIPGSNGFALLFRIGDVLLMDFRDLLNPCCVFRANINNLPHSVYENNVDEDMYRDIDDDVAAHALLQLGVDDPMCIDSESGRPLKNDLRVCCWSWEPENHSYSRVIFSLENGDMFIAEISVNSDSPKIDFSECLYKGLPCNKILWAKNSFITAFVDMGDGIVLKLEDGKVINRNSINNNAPILDISVIDFKEEKGSQIFSCCGVLPEGSLRIVRNGVTVEKLLNTTPIYQGITGTWALRMSETDTHHSFLVLSFVEETRVLSVGVNFTDVTDFIGFRSDVCTLACGLVLDGLLVQIHRNSIELCKPTHSAHGEGVPFVSPVCSSWFPGNQIISLGAVKNNLVVVSTSNPCSMYILGVHCTSPSQYQLYELQKLKMLNELSCIFVPQSNFRSTSMVEIDIATSPLELEMNNLIVIGTHRPSVEVLSFEPQAGLRVLAAGVVVLTNNSGAAVSGCVPQDVRLVLSDRMYILCGLRNGMLLRFEWPSSSSMFSLEMLTPGCPSMSSNSVSDTLPTYPQSHSCDLNLDTIALPVKLELVSTRRIGVTPVFLVPLNNHLNSNIIILSGKPWLLQSTRHSISYTSISFQPSTHATSVCSHECPDGVLFVSENSLHLVEMVRDRNLNVEKFNIHGTPRRVLYHSESKLLFVLRTNINDESCSSDVCCVNPINGSIVSCFKLEIGETGKSMELVRVANEEVLVVGTSLSMNPLIMPSGEAESTKGRLLVLCLEHVQSSDTGSMTFSTRTGSFSRRTSPFREMVGIAENLSGSSAYSSPDDGSCDGGKLEESDAWHLRLASATPWPGMVLAICPYLERYFLASAGNAFYVCGFANDTPQKVRKMAVGRTRFMITSLKSNATRIVVGDSRDGILFFSYSEDTKKLEQNFSDPCQRLVADCALIDSNTVVVSDRKGSIAFLTCSESGEGSSNPEKNLTLCCAYYVGEVSMSIKKVLHSHKLSTDDFLSDQTESLAKLESLRNTVVASTLLGSILFIIPLSRAEYELLESVQAKLQLHPLTAPLLGNNHYEFRGRENQSGVPQILDGDMLLQLLELTSAQQNSLLAAPSTRGSLPKAIPVKKVVQLLERIQYALS